MNIYFNRCRADIATKGRGGARDADADPSCLIRATLGSKKISTIVRSFIPY